MQSIPLTIEQTAPGRYVGEFDSAQAGQLPDLGHAAGDRRTIRTGVNVGYSDEFRDRETNTPLLESHRRAAGQARRSRASCCRRCRSCRKTPRRPSRSCSRSWRSTRSAATCRRRWPARISGRGSCWRRAAAFLRDVFVRRVQVNFQWLAPIWTRFVDVVLRPRAPRSRAGDDEPPAQPQSRSRSIDRKPPRRHALRAGRGDAGRSRTPSKPPKPSPRPPAPTAMPTAKPVAEAEPEDDYTSRLLKAKKQVWKDRPTGSQAKTRVNDNK